MKKFVLLGLTALMSASLWQEANAQPPGNGPGGWGGPGRGMRMGDRDKMQLNRLWRGIDELQSSNSLSKAQAKNILSLVRPWSSKPQMTSAQAKILTSKISNVLTTAQKTQLQNMRGGRDRDGRGGEGRDGRNRDGRDRRGDGPPRDGQMGGRREDGRPGGNGDGPPPGFDSTKMRAQMQKMEALQKTMNPFYPPSRYAQVKSMPTQMREGMTRRYDRMRATLTALARRAA